MNDRLRHYSERRQAAGLDRLLDDLDAAPPLPRFPGPMPSMRLVLDEPTPAPLPDAVSGLAGRTAHAIWRAGLEELPIAEGANPERFLWLAGAAVDVALREAKVDRNRVLGGAGLIICVVVLATFAVAGLWIGGARW